MNYFMLNWYLFSIKNKENNLKKADYMDTLLHRLDVSLVGSLDSLAALMDTRLYGPRQ